MFTFQMSFALFDIKTDRSCHLSVLHMNQNEELGTKHIFGVITLLITNYLIFCRFNCFLSSYRFIYIIAILLQELIVFFLQDSSLLCVHGLFS